MSAPAARLGAMAVVGALLLGSCTTAAAGSTTAGPEVQTDGAGDNAPSAGPDVARDRQEATVIDFDLVPDGAAFIARPAVGALVIFDEPDGTRTHEIARVDERGVRAAMAIVGEPGEQWTRVQVAVRPNFTLGWARTSDLDVSWTTLRIEISLNDQKLTLLDGDTELTHGTVSIGRPTMPTPTGITYVSELLASTDPDDLYGPFALGLALFSDTVTEYAGGNGQVGIHGTNTPDLLGQAVSHGCVRTHNDLIRDLAGRVPLGTPVEIVA